MGPPSKEARDARTGDGRASSNTHDHDAFCIAAALGRDAARLVAGIDTIRLTWRGGTAASWLRALRDRDTIHAPSLDALGVPVRRVKSGRIARCPVTGLRFGFVETPGDHGGYFPWVEHRAAALVAQDRRDRTLLPQARLIEAEAAAVSILAHYGITVCPDSRCLVQRYDLTVDLHALDLAEELRAVALMSALARIELPRLKRGVTHARESARVQSVGWFHQSKANKKGQIKRETRVLAYQKGEELRERLGEDTAGRPGSITRIEFRVWPEAAKRRSPAELAYDDLRPQLAGYFAKHDLSNLRVAHPSDALRLLAARVGEMELRGKSKDGSPRVLTPRVAERMGGTMLVLLAGLEDTFWRSPQTRRARKAELRAAGVLLSDDALLDAPPVDLGEYLGVVVAAFAPVPPPAPAAAVEPVLEPPAQAELPGMPARRRPRVWV